MKLEKRSEGGPVEPAGDTAPKGKKPVVVYIMVLFIAAFLLMAWSFASHQRRNTEALGRLQSSVTAMQEVQDLQDQVIALQKELSEAQKTIEKLEDTSAAQEYAVNHLENQLNAMQLLYILQQQFSAKDFKACRQTIQAFESQNCTEHLPRLDNGSVTTLADRYQQLKEAVEAREAESSEEKTPQASFG